VTELQTLLAAKTELPAEEPEPEAAETAAEETEVVEEETVPEEETVTEPEAVKMTVEQIAGRGYVGILEIPSLGLILPVLDDCTDANLKSAPCRYYGSIAEDNLVIAGHNYKQHFGYLPNVRRGDTVTFTDMDGIVYTYEVGVVETLAANAVKEMNESDWEMSLYTCTYSGNERITVRCRRTEE
ncbi:MAG: sortase, partial [Clostridia bacterium]|nr:sortase [Clostridia bacterium]